VIRGIFDFQAWIFVGESHGFEEVRDFFLRKEKRRD